MSRIKLSDCSYKNITKSFYYGMIGDFKLVIDKETDYFNATKLCEQGGKLYCEWSRLSRTQELIAFYSRQNKSFIYEIKGNTQDKFHKEINGVYVPREFILNIIFWLFSSLELYDRCNNIIVDNFLRESQVMTIKTLRRKITEADKRIENLKLLLNQ